MLTERRASPPITTTCKVSGHENRLRAVREAGYELVPEIEANDDNVDCYLALAGATDLAAIPGHDVYGRVDDHELLPGNYRLLRDRGIDSPDLTAE